MGKISNLRLKRPCHKKRREQGVTDKELAVLNGELPSGSKTCSRPEKPGKKKTPKKTGSLPEKTNKP